MNLTREDFLDSQIIELIGDDSARQRAWARFWSKVYPEYRLNPKLYYSISETGKLVPDPYRARQEPVRKISKSDQ